MRSVECEVCGKETRMKEYKDLSSGVHTNMKYVKTECGHRFLIEHDDKKVI